MSTARGTNRNRGRGSVMATMSRMAAAKKPLQSAAISLRRGACCGPVVDQPQAWNRAVRRVPLRWDCGKVGSGIAGAGEPFTCSFCADSRSPNVKQLATWLTLVMCRRRRSIPLLAPGRSLIERADRRLAGVNLKLSRRCGTAGLTLSRRPAKSRGAATPREHGPAAERREKPSVLQQAASF